MSTNVRSMNSDEIWRIDRGHVPHPWTHCDRFRRDGSLSVADALGAIEQVTRTPALGA